MINVGIEFLIGVVIIAAIFGIRDNVKKRRDKRYLDALYLYDRLAPLSDEDREKHLRESSWAERRLWRDAVDTFGPIKNHYLSMVVRLAFECGLVDGSMITASSLWSSSPEYKPVGVDEATEQYRSGQITLEQWAARVDMCQTLAIPDMRESTKNNKLKRLRQSDPDLDKFLVSLKS